MNGYCYFDWSSLLAPLTTVGAALLAFLLGQATYRRQKEYELVRARYLEGGIDRFATNVEYALGAIRHNWARTLQILKLFRDVDVEEAADLANRSSFILIESGRIDLEAGYRIQTLTRDGVYGRAQGRLFALANSAEYFFVHDVGALIRRAASGEISVTDQPEVLERAVAQAQKYQSDTHRFYDLFYRLQDLGRVLERRHVSFREIDRFAEDPVVKEISERLRQLFPPKKGEEDQTPGKEFQ